MAKAKNIPQTLKDGFEVSDNIPGKFYYKGVEYVTETLNAKQAEKLAADAKFPYIKAKKKRVADAAEAETSQKKSGKG